MKAIYLKEKNLWNANSHLLDSGTWKMNTKKKQEGQLYIKKTIGNGRNTSLWYDPWLQEGIVAELLGEEMPIQVLKIGQ